MLFLECPMRPVSILHRRALWFLLLIFALCTAAQAHGQAFGEISGTATDTTHAALPNVSLRLVNEATGTSVPSRSNGSGIFILPQLLPRRYTLTASRSGFDN